jgi:hypothetical protein
MTRRVALLTLVMLIPGTAISQGSGSPVDGVWRVTEIVTTGANGSTISSPQPSLIIFARGHYSWLNVNGTTARKQSPPVATPGKPTDAEKAVRFDEWQPLTANTGTFEVKGNTLTRRLLVAKNVGAMAPTAAPVSQQFKIDGDTLWLTGPSVGNPQGETRYKLTRVR